MVRIVVAEKGLADRVEEIVVQTRTTDAPCYAINPSGRVPYLVTDEGVGLEESQLIIRAALRGGNRAVWKPWPAVCSTANRCGAANCTALPMNVRRRLSITNVTAAGAWPKSGKRKSTTR
ncbi:MAG: hypothetical protein HN540_14580 [Rhodospirillaceae bacterium]|nr:hypothetical protein [Rhodospirillaceae bacterium]